MSLIERIGRIGEETYLTRVFLTPSTRWGQLYLHIFHRGDSDPDPHDHPFSFWTFPLMPYVERVWDESGWSINVVRAWRWHRRNGDYKHRVLGRYSMDRNGLGTVSQGRSVITLVWRTKRWQSWGFWVEDDSHILLHVDHSKIGERLGQRVKVPWREYIRATTVLRAEAELYRRPLLVQARTMAEATTCTRDAGLQPRDWVLVTDHEYLCGLPRGSLFVTVGNYRYADHFKEITTMMSVYQMVHVELDEYMRKRTYLQSCPWYNG